MAENIIKNKRAIERLLFFISQLWRVESFVGLSSVARHLGNFIYG